MQPSPVRRNRLRSTFLPKTKCRTRHQSPGTLPAATHRQSKSSFPRLLAAQRERQRHHQGSRREIRQRLFLPWPERGRPSNLPHDAQDSLVKLNVFFLVPCRNEPSDEQV